MNGRGSSGEGPAILQIGPWRALRTLALIGIGCVLAGIVGGGLTFLGIEFPVIDSWPRQLILGLVGVLLVVLAIIGAPPYPAAPVAVPAGPVPFVERIDENGASLVETALRTIEESHLVLLSGPGGVGKTTLASEIGRRWQTAVQGRRLIRLEVETLPRVGPGALLVEIAVQAGCSPLRGDPARREQTIRSALADGLSLVMVDGLEHVGQDREAWLAYLRLFPSPVLITSRDRVPGVRTISIDSMGPAEAKEFLERVIAQSGNSVAFSEATQTQLLAVSEGNPQVIEWLAGQISLGRRPRDVFSELRRGKGAAADRVFHSSFGLRSLRGDGQVVLLALGIFATDASRRALAWVAGFDEDWPRLDAAILRLSGLRLIVTSDDAERIAVQGLTRDFVRARLAVDRRRRKLRKRFVGFFHRMAEEIWQTTDSNI